MKILSVISAMEVILGNKEEWNKRRDRNGVVAAKLRMRANTLHVSFRVFFSLGIGLVYFCNGLIVLIIKIVC